jgi:glycosyltransferase involved in cell wall biosynthesis
MQNLLAELGPHVEATVMGVDAPVVHTIAARRPGTGTRLVPPARHKWSFGPILAHVRTVRKLRPDVLHASLRTPWTCQYGILAGLLSPGTRVLAEEQLPLASGVGAQRLVKRVLCSRLDAHVSVGEHAARLIEQLAELPAGSVRGIPNGVPEVDAGHPERPFEGPTVGSLGRLSDQKAFHVLVEALAELPQASLVLVGDGPERARIERLAAELGVADRLLITGWREDAARWLAAFDVFALPSLYEGLPLAVLEAMRAGLPVVATDVGSVAEAVVPEETGLLVQPGDARAFAGALRRLLDDPELLSRMGRRGRERALERFTIERRAAEFEQLYEDLRTRRRSSRPARQRI